MLELLDVVDEAHEALLDGRLDDARAALERAKRIDAGDREVRLLELEVLDDEGRLTDAVTAARAAHVALPRSMAIQLKLAELLLDAGDAGARSLLEELLERVDAGEEPDVERTGGETTTEPGEFLVGTLLALSDARAHHGDARGALAAAQRLVATIDEAPVEHSAFAAVAHMSVAMALFELARVDAALAAVVVALAQQDPFADIHWLHGRILTARGEDDRADEAFARAMALDADHFRMPLRITELGFAQLIDEARAQLPERDRASLTNILIVAAERPDSAAFARSDPPRSAGEKAIVDGARITLFRKNLEIASSTKDEMCMLLVKTLREASSR